MRIAVVLLLLAVSERAWACAACSCGDPTLTSMGTEKPYQNRLRGALVFQHRTDLVGDEFLSEQRIDLQLSWAPHPRVFLSVAVPALRREVTFADLSRTTIYNLGDVELRAKFFLWQDRPFQTRHLLSVLGGVRLPTAPQIGPRLSPELQGGSGSIDPIVGAQYALFLRPVSAFVSTYAVIPTYGFYGYLVQPSVRVALAAQYEVTRWFSPRLGIDLRFDGKSKENGALVADSGGFIAFLSAELLFAPVMDALLIATIRIPVISALQGIHREGVYFSFGAAYDFI